MASCSRRRRRHRRPSPCPGCPPEALPQVANKPAYDGRATEVRLQFFGVLGFFMFFQIIEKDAFVTN